MCTTPYAFIYCTKWRSGEVSRMPYGVILKDRATQLLIKYKSGALAAQKKFPLKRNDVSLLALFFSAIKLIIYCNAWHQMYPMHAKESERETEGFDLMPLSPVPQSSCKLTKVRNQSLSTTLLPHLGQNSSRGSQGVTSPSPLGPSLKVFPQLDQSQLFLSTFTQFQICVSSFSLVVSTWLPLRRRFSQSLQQDSSPECPPPPSGFHIHLFTCTL